MATITVKAVKRSAFSVLLGGGRVGKMTIGCGRRGGVGAEGGAVTLCVVGDSSEGKAIEGCVLFWLTLKLGASGKAV